MLDLNINIFNNLNVNIEYYQFHNIGHEWTSGPKPNVNKSHTVHFVLAGEAQCKYNKQVFNLTPGTLWLAPGGLQIERICKKNYHHLELIINVHGLGSRDLLKESNEPLVLDQISPQAPFYATMLKELKSNTLSIQSCIIISGRIRSGLVYSKTYIQNVKRQNQGYELFSAAFHYLQAHLSINLRVDDLAKVQNMHRTAFSRAFKKKIGLAPKEYIHLELNSLALEYVRTTQMAIKEIAHKLGFNDAFYFSRFFKRHNKFSPQALRKML
jgi:AraC-like DNA-binding protein